MYCGAERQTCQPHSVNHQTDGKFQHLNAKGADLYKNCYSDNKNLLDFASVRIEGVFPSSMHFFNLKMKHSLKRPLNFFLHGLTKHPDVTTSVADI